MKVTIASFANFGTGILQKSGGYSGVADLRVILGIQAVAGIVGVDLAKPPEHLQRQLDQLELPVVPSKFADEVSTALLDMGFSHERTVSPVESMPPGLLPIDLACVDRMIAIECDGPEHFLQVLGNSEIAH